MKLRTITSRAVAAGATTALAAGALVAASAPATAATVSNTYTCDIALAQMSYDMTLEVTGELPVPQYWAGAGVPAGLLQPPVTVTSEVDPAVAGMLGEYGVSHARSDDFSVDLGQAVVPIPVEGDFVSEGETTTWEASGTNLDFVTPNPGLTEAVLPQGFTFTAETEAFGDFPIPCSLKEGETPQTLASIELLRQSSETLADNVTAKKGKKVVVPVAVNSTSLGGGVNGGKVVATKGKKTLGSAKVKNGKAKINLGKKLKGKNKVTITYKGIPSVGGSSDKITVTIKKK